MKMSKDMKKEQKINNERIVEELKIEIEKWTKRMEDELEKIKTQEDEIIKNIKAYVSDSKYFYSRGDLVRAFEAIIWAWALFEINFKK